jgi:hypothetical protein
MKVITKKEEVEVKELNENKELVTKKVEVDVEYLQVPLGVKEVKKETYIKDLERNIARRKEQVKNINAEIAKDEEKLAELKS